MGILTQILGLLLSLSILVILHELGHFIFARIFKTRVEKFYLFFDPWFSLFKIKKGDTEYGLGWLPLGGYVKISGMIDESMDKEAMKLPPKPYEFRAKPAWQRLLIMLGGVMVNFILALGIYSMILFVWGDDYIKAKDVRYGYEFHPYAKELGFQDGDIITHINEQEIDNYSDIFGKMLIDNASSVTVLRNGIAQGITIPDNFTNYVVGEEISDLLIPRVPFVVDSIIPGEIAEGVGFMKHDSIVALNGETASFYYQFESLKKGNYGKEVEVTVSRNNELVNLSFTLPEDGFIGLGNKQISDYFNLQKIEYGFLQSIPAGINLGVETLVFYVKQMKLVFSKEGITQLGGFGTIGSLFPKKWDWNRFWTMTAFLSVILAFMNILPIPALDGGHVMFLLFEIIVGKKPGDRFLEYAQVTGMIILLGLLLFANANDIVRLFK